MFFFLFQLKLMVPSKASDNNSIWVYPITFGGGLVGGDSVEMSFHVKKNCCAVITGQESTKVNISFSMFNHKSSELLLLSSIAYYVKVHRCLFMFFKKEKNER